MRVLCVGAEYPPPGAGGYELWCEQAVQDMRAHGHRVRVLAGTGPAREPDRHAEVHRVLPRGRPAASDDSSARVMAEHLRAFRPDAVCWWRLAGLAPSLVDQVRRRGIPAVGAVGDAWMLDFPSDARLGAAAEWLFVSEHLRRRVLEGGVVLPRTGIAPAGIDLAALPARAPARPWRGRLLYAGRLSPLKGADVALRALAELDDPMTLTLIGPALDPGYRRELDELVRALDLRSRVAFEPPRPARAMADAYAAADALVFPSRWEEPWGLVPLEAMACGVPVLATGTGGSAEYLEDGVNALLTPPGDPAALARAIRRLAVDDDLRARLTQRGRRTAERFPVEECAGRVRTAVERAGASAAVISGPGGARSDEHDGARQAVRAMSALETNDSRRVGVAIVGLGGAVATTVVAGIELLRRGLVGPEGLPLAGSDADLVPYVNLAFGGWDVCGDDLAVAAAGHDVLPADQLNAVASSLEDIVPWPAASDPAFCRNVDGTNRVSGSGLRARTEQIRADLRRFADAGDLDATVVVNLASTERPADLSAPGLATLAGFEQALDADDPVISPAMLYAYAALREGVPYANFTPSVAVDVPALVELAEEAEVPVAGKDGKTGQTMLKTLIAPGLRARSLKVEGWFSSNILGNRDGLALDDPDSLQSKLDTKGSVLDDILGYDVEDHVVTINYYRPRGDAKEAWDNVDLVGFLGQRMQLKVNFLCRDSVLAAPLVIEIARALDLAHRRGEGGVQEQLGAFFKAPMVAEGQRPEHALMAQEERLRSWLGEPAVLRT